jgi:N-acetyl sugar amidotransferase
MKYCKNCLQIDSRPNTEFDNNGLCPACKYHNSSLKLDDWGDRLIVAQEIVEQRKRKPGQYFDCIIGVSGGKDSTRQALWVRDKLGMTPLLVCLCYPPEQVTERGVENISNLIELGFDVLISSLSPKTWKKVIKTGFYKFANWARGTEVALYSSVPQIAIKYDIKVIFWGENPALQLGDMKTLGKTGYDGNNLREMNTLSGGNGALEWMIDEGIERNKLGPYIYPDAKKFDLHDIQIIYLGWFWGDWSLVNNAVYACLEGLELREDGVENTGDLYGVTALDEDWVTLNQMIKYYKYGFGRVSDYVNEGIRMLKMTREQGIELVEKYDDSCGDEYIESFCSYIEITVEEFWEQVHKNVNKDLFTIESDGGICRKFKVGIGL